MLSFLVQRVLAAIPTLFIISLIVFSLQQLMPGDPALVIGGGEASPEMIAQIREQYGFNDPFLVQYWHWISNVVQGDFGGACRKAGDRTRCADKHPTFTPC